MENKNGERNFAETLLDAGYSSCEIYFNVKLKRKGIMKWLENNKLIKAKREGFALMVRDFNNIDILSSGGDTFSIMNTKVNGLR